MTIKQQLPEVRSGNGDFFGVRINATDAPKLKLVLPARKEVVVDDFYHALWQEYCQTIYLYFATLESHQLAYEHWQRAAELGVNLPEAEQSLISYQPRRADGDQPDFFYDRESVANNGLILSAELSIAQAQSFWRGFDNFDSGYVLYEPLEQYQGYSWYDSLPQLTEVCFSLEQAGQRFSVADWVKSLHGDRPEAIWVNTKIVRSDGSESRLQFKTDVALDEADCCYGFDLSEAVVLVVETSQIEVADLVELLEAAFFDPSYDCEADSVCTQREDFQEMAAEIATSVLYSKAEALSQRLRLAVERYIRWLVPHKWKVEITIDGTQVSIEQTKQPS